MGSGAKPGRSSDESQPVSFHRGLPTVKRRLHSTTLVKPGAAVYVARTRVTMRVATIMQRAIWVLLSASMWLCASCDRRIEPVRDWRPDDHGQPAQDDSRVATQAPAEAGGSERAALALYRVTCASCHGIDGRGQGEGRPPGAQLPDFTARTFQSKRSDAELVQIVREGRGLMPAFGKQINDQGLAALVALVRRFGEVAGTDVANKP
jgi:mono/diheme cytochrome c family protein